jgi:hypothetical protein
MVISYKIKILLVSCIIVLSMVFSLSACNNPEETLSSSDESIFKDTAINNTVTEVEIVSGIIIPYTLDELIESADVIVSGTVIDILPSKEGQLLKNDNRTLIYTDVIIKVQTYLKGQTGYDTIAVRTRGGQVGDKVIIAEDEPEFDIGEQVLLYLAFLDIGEAPEGMNMQSVLKLDTTQGKAVIKGDTVINADKDNSILSIQELTEKINSIQSLEK